MTAIVLRGDARQLPLPDASVDLIVTSPPWRCSDPGERARARDMPKPPPIPDGMEPLFTM